MTGKIPGLYRIYPEDVPLLSARLKSAMRDMPDDLCPYRSVE